SLIRSSQRSMNLPNALTVGRIFLVPLLVVVLLTKFEGRLILGVRKELVGAAIFGLASLTDVLDGYLARRRKQITTLGQVMDPLAVASRWKSERRRSLPPTRTIINHAGAGAPRSSGDAPPMMTSRPSAPSAVAQRRSRTLASASPQSASTFFSRYRSAPAGSG